MAALDGRVADPAKAGASTRTLTGCHPPRDGRPVPPPSAADQTFIDRRRAGAGGRWLLPSLVLTLLGLVWIGLFAWAPSLVNPKHVIGQIEQKAIEAGTLTLYAVAATLLANLVMLLLCVIGVLLLAAAAQERRYLRMLERPAAGPAPSPPTTSNDTVA